MVTKKPGLWGLAKLQLSSTTVLILLCANSNSIITETLHLGSSATRAGWSFEDVPRLNVTPIYAKYRDRKWSKTYSFVGKDVYADTTARGHMRNAFEAGSGIVSNWDVMESILDYIFIKMGIDGSNGGVDVPIIMTEAVANLPYTRKCES